MPGAASPDSAGRLVRQSRRKVSPRCVGLWLVEVEQNEVTKYGKNGDTKFPMPPNTPKKEIVAMVDHLRELSDPNSRYYVFKLFDNGQMKHFYATDEDG